MNQSNYLFVLCSDDALLHEHLEDVLAPLGKLKVLSLEQALNPEHWLQHNLDIAVCFMDFIEESHNPTKFTKLKQIAKLLLSQHTGLPLIALGSTEHANSAIQAMRSGIDEFVDPGQEHELLSTTERLLTPQSIVTSHSAHYTKHIVIMGVRPGVGATTFSTHLSSYLQDHIEAAHNTSQVLLLDLGWPLTDSLIYLNTNSQFRLNDALNNLHRLDQTLLYSALAKTGNELHILANTNDPTSQRASTPQELNTLIQRLAQAFSHIITDLDPQSNPALLNAALQHSHEVWLVTDQNIAALVSLSTLLEKINPELHNKVKLIINRYDIQAGLSSENIAQQFNLPLLITLPEQRKALMIASSQGKTLGSEQAQNPYYKAIKQLCEQQFSLPTSPTFSGKTNSLLSRLFSKRKS